MKARTRLERRNIRWQVDLSATEAQLLSTIVFEWYEAFIDSRAFAKEKALASRLLAALAKAAAEEIE